MVDRRRESLGDAGLGQQPLRLRHVVVDEVARAGRVHLVGGHLPFRHGTRDRARVQAALAEVQRGAPGLAIDGQGDGPPHAHVVERRLIGPHVDVGDVHHHLRGDHHLGVRALERAALLGCQPAPPVGELQLARAQQ